MHNNNNVLLLLLYSESLELECLDVKPIQDCIIFCLLLNLRGQKVSNLQKLKVIQELHLVCCKPAPVKEPTAYLFNSLF